MKQTCLIFLLIVCLSVHGQDDKYLPKGGEVQIIHHKNYSLGYSEKHEQALWVAYELLSSEVSGSFERTDNFRPDPMVIKGSAQLDDYRGSRYDRGHLAPAGDMGFSAEAMSESFYLSNMSPQDPSFNRGAWKKIESFVRDWTKSLGSLYVITGPVLKNTNDVKDVIGKNKVSVPKMYYKIVLSEENEQAIGFIYWNLKGAASDPWKVFRSIDEIEAATSLDFFAQLPDQLETRIEGRVSSEFWASIDISNPGSLSSKEKQLSVSVQCEGLAMSTGVRCKNMTLNKNEYCHSHQDQVNEVSDNTQNSLLTSVRCEGVAKSTGVRCKNMTLNGNNHCHYHQSQVGQSKNYQDTSSQKNYTTSRCTATTQAGTRCKRAAQSGRSRCWQH